MPEETLPRSARRFVFRSSSGSGRFSPARGRMPRSWSCLANGSTRLEVGRSTPDLTAEAMLAGIIFGWLLSFRTQTAHARWWEGRSLWGQLVNDSRNLVLKAASLVPDAGGRGDFPNSSSVSAESLRDHLRSRRRARPAPSAGHRRREFCVSPIVAGRGPH